MISKFSFNALIGLLLLWTLPLVAAASELEHVVQGLEYVVLFFVLLLAILLGIGFATKFLVWPNIHKLTGKVITGLLTSAVAWLILIAVVYWLSELMSS